MHKDTQCTHTLHSSVHKRHRIVAPFHLGDAVGGVFKPTRKWVADGLYGQVNGQRAMGRVLGRQLEGL